MPTYYHLENPSTSKTPCATCGHAENEHYPKTFIECQVAGCNCNRWKKRPGPSGTEILDRGPAWNDLRRVEYREGNSRTWKTADLRIVTYKLCHYCTHRDWDHKQIPSPVGTACGTFPPCGCAEFKRPRAVKGSKSKLGPFTTGQQNLFSEDQP